MGILEITDHAYGHETYVLASWLFLKLLGLIYLAAFASLATQIRGLAGARGILPAAEFFKARRHCGVARFFRWPSLFWFNSSDGFLVGLSWGGAGLAVLLIIGVAPAPIILLLWISYLSLFTACSLFLYYQWDILLLEAGFLALFLAPPQLAPGLLPNIGPPTISIWLFWWLLFRLMFWSGAAKLRSGDTAWRNLTALRYHYETQPLPTPLAWHFHHLPAWFHKCSVVVVLAIELVAPFLILAPPPWRHAAGGLFIGLMILIQLTGNYAFFNWLGIALSLLLFDDRVLRPLCGSLLLHGSLSIRGPSSVSTAIAVLAALLLVPLSVDSIPRLVPITLHWPRALARFFDALEPFRLANRYGLFSIMTTRRPEIILEGSEDGRSWREYTFKWKPGDLNRAPRFVAPHQPRLDWQMWFAALGVVASTSWVEQLQVRLLQGSPAVLSLLKLNPFPDGPPRYVRGVLYEYRFASRAERRATGAWWQRERRGIFEAQGASL